MRRRTTARIEREHILDAFALNRSRLMRYAWLSIAAALVTMALKGAAYWLTGSVGLFSDALESMVNLLGAIMALAMLSVAARPPDEEHAYGHSKAEYFSSGFEGSLILFAAASIAIAAIQRIVVPVGPTRKSRPANDFRKIVSTGAPRADSPHGAIAPFCKRRTVAHDHPTP